MVIDTPEGIRAYHLLAIKGAFKLETLGIKSRHGSLKKVIVRETNGEVKNRRDKNQMLAEYEQWLVDKGILIR